MSADNSAYADAPRFAWIALGGVALQWAITLSAVFITTPGISASAAAAANGSDNWLARLSAAHNAAEAGPGQDTGANPGTGSTSIPRSVLDPDRVNRPGLVLAITFWALGVVATIRRETVSKHTRIA